MSPTPDQTFRVRPLRPDDATRAVEIEALSYPFLAGENRLQASDVDDHSSVYPEGAFAVVDTDDLLWGMALGWRMDFDFDEPIHTLEEVAHPSRHQPDGDWYYGLDITVHPDQRGHGLGHLLYEARRSLVRASGMRGIIAGGMIPGYRAVMDELDAPSYIAEVIEGKRHDPTLTFQLGEGFQVRGLLPGYVSGTAGGGIATLLVWEA